MRILVLGASGMLGHVVYRVFAGDQRFEVFGTVRSNTVAKQLPNAANAKLITGIDTDSQDALLKAFIEAKPNVVINCVGVIKQLQGANDPLTTLPINALLPHRLARMAEVSGARLIHVSTDCVFSGSKGGYLESDRPDAVDLYGRSKLLGEVDRANAITLRTSIIGPELGGGATGLVGWFLSQSGSVKGYRRAIFSGFPTVTLARLIRDKVLPRPDLSGLYHASVAPIDKYSLLTIVQNVYEKTIAIEPDDHLVIDRSLNSDRFRNAVNYEPPSWGELVKEMHAFG